VVARLFDLVRPAVAVFGEKDYQQLLTITALVAAAADRWPGLRIEPHLTIREADGLALSSRNVHIPTDRRDDALGLTRALQAACAANSVETAEQVMQETLVGHTLDVEYTVIRDATDLSPVGSFARPTRALIAARLDDVRLIDNRAMPVWD
jgi:pantoate--beta-alanine ligase